MRAFARSIAWLNRTNTKQSTLREVVGSIARTTRIHGGEVLHADQAVQKVLAL